MEWVAFAKRLEHHEFSSEWVTIDHNYFNTAKECKDWVEACESNCTDENIIFTYQKEKTLFVCYMCGKADELILLYGHAAKWDCYQCGTRNEFKLNEEAAEGGKP